MSSDRPASTLDGGAPTALAWPDGIDERHFLARYWQQRPLLMRQALPRFDTPLPADELAGLALEEDTTPRLIRRDADGRYRLTHGPFDNEDFATLGSRDWSLLVTDVEKHLPELQAWLRPFRIVPDWRFDDLMISHAPDGASVGAHVDQYDVFLLQASGTRRWAIDTREGIDFGEETVGDLGLVKDFVASEVWDLEPGDILYLPPGVPHHGVAIGDDCTTWSVGFRAPAIADIVTHAADWLAESLPLTRLKVDAEKRLAPGEISAETLREVLASWQSATQLDHDALLDITGTLLTRSGASDEADVQAAGVDARAVAPCDSLLLQTSPFARVAWAPKGQASDVLTEPADRAGVATAAPIDVARDAPTDTVTGCATGCATGSLDEGASSVRLFANGEALDCPRYIAISVCDGGIDTADCRAPEDVDLVLSLLAEGVLIPAEDAD